MYQKFKTPYASQAHDYEFIHLNLIRYTMHWIIKSVVGRSDLHNICLITRHPTSDLNLTFFDIHKNQTCTEAPRNIDTTILSNPTHKFRTMIRTKNMMTNLNNRVTSRWNEFHLHRSMEIVLLTDNILLI